MTDDAHAYALQQIAAADTGHADNQCPDCGVYRTDGHPPAPATHRASCHHERSNTWLQFPIHPAHTPGSVA